MRPLLALALCTSLVSLSAGAARADEKKQAPETKVDAVPVVGGDGDIGLGVGVVGAVTRKDPRRKPYVWRAETALLVSFKPSPSGEGIIVPFQDYYFQLTLPHLLQDALRLEVRPSFTQETTQRYYGLGNASLAPSPDGPSDAGSQFYQYTRVHPTMSVRARLHLGDNFFALLGNSYTHNWLEVRPDSRLSRDMAEGSPTVRRILGDLRPHNVYVFEYGLLYDRRDNEISTRRGMYHQVKLGVSPGGTETFPYRYARLGVNLRGYVPIGKRVVFAARAVADLLGGNPPFYELARFEDSSALGGVHGVRGVPAQRYYGKLKLLGNVELRARIVDFKMFDRNLALGVAAFLDGGRAWTELEDSHPELDGNGLGLKYGTGAGLRLHQGDTFVVRGDIAWSPDARPIGGYFSAGEMF